MSTSDRDRFARLQTLFHAIVDLPDVERQRRLEELRQDREDLFDELMALLEGPEGQSAQREEHEQALERLVAEPEEMLEGLPIHRDPPDEYLPDDDCSGQLIGPYRVIRLLGEGGRPLLLHRRDQLLSRATRVCTVPCEYATVKAPGFDPSWD